MYARIQEENQVQGRRLVLQAQQGLFSYFNFEFLQYIAMYNRIDESPQTADRRLIHQLEQELFTYLNLPYEVYDIPVSNDETIHAVVVRSRLKKNGSRDFYVGHGFGGSSLMSFAVIEPLLKKGNVIFWETRGMGFSKKQAKYAQKTVQQIEQYFLSTIRVILSHFNPQNSTFVCHSFSAYLLLRFATKYPELTKKHIAELILLSTIGVTAREQDYKNKIAGCADFLEFLLNRFGWAFKLTFKSPLRTLCRCCKESILAKHLNSADMSQKEKELMAKIIKTLIQLPDGSQQLFFSYFQPRVLPRVALEPLILSQPAILVTLVYGGPQDWVDKTGAVKLANRFPEKIRLIGLEPCGHNIPMHAQECIKLFQNLIK